MRTLMWLYLVKIKGQIRNVFSKPTSAIFTILLLLLYGGGFIAILMNPDEMMSMMNIQDIHNAIMIAIGFTALMIGSLLMQSRSALFFENDAFYLFTGPFKRSQVMQYLMSNTILSSLLFSALAMMMLVFFSAGIGFTAGFLLLSFALIFLISFFFIVLKDYLYLLSIQNEKLKYVAKAIVFLYAVLVMAVFLMVAAQHQFDFKVAGPAFLSSDAFYILPLFGWCKLALVSLVEGNVAMTLLGSGLVTAACVVIFILMSRYRGNFVEKAMQDAEEFTALYKEVRAGKRNSMNDTKVKNIKGAFKEGAAAIFSKNMLLMKKTNDFLRIQDIVVIGIYLVIALLVDLGFFFFCYMLVFWLFSVLQNSDFMRDMNNYQIYLIPDDPFKKLWNAIKAILIKLWMILGISVILGGLLFQVDILHVVQYLLMTFGYAFLFVAATVLSLRIMKSRSNMMVENMLRMLLIVVCSIPSVLVILPFMFMESSMDTMMNVIMGVNLLMNFVLSFGILYACRNMMKGRELKSE